MGFEFEIMSFSTLVFGLLLAFSLKPLKTSYAAREVANQKVIEKQRIEENKCFTQELANITESFEKKFSKALQGELQK